MEEVNDLHHHRHHHHSCDGSKSDESSDMDDDHDEQGGTTTTEPDPTDSSRDEVGVVRKMSSRDTFRLRLYWR